LLSTDVSNQVRGIQRGWRFADPYYICLIEVQNPEGMSINVGKKPIWIDGQKFTNEIGPSTLRGKGANSTGIHEIRVHKSCWIDVDPTCGTLAALKAADALYPYNHKMIIEGYPYDGDFLDGDKVYTGVDLFAEKLLKQVSLFNFTQSIEPTNYGVFALDLDGPSTHTGDNDASQVFLVKVDESRPDFQQERFVLRFTQLNQLQKYLRLRVDFVTENSEIAPILYGYKIKLA
jgi:hypothetical protein